MLVSDQLKSLVLETRRAVCIAVSAAVVLLTIVGWSCELTASVGEVGWVLLYVHRNRRLIRDGSPGRPPRLSHSFWALTASVEVLLYVHRNRRLIMDGRPVEVLLYVHRNRRLIRDGRPVEVLLYVHRNRRLIRDGSPGLSHSPWALTASVLPPMYFACGYVWWINCHSWMELLSVDCRRGYVNVVTLSAGLKVSSWSA